MNDHFFPYRTSVRVLKEMHFIENDNSKIVHIGRAGINHVAQDFGRHHHDRRLGVNAVVSGKQPNFVCAVQLH